MTEREDIWACTPAGGVGSRLWPLSTTAMPKFLIDVTGSGRTLLQGVHDRLAPLVGDRFVVVTNERYVDQVGEQLPLVPRAQILGEPSGKDSMAAIGLAAAWIERRDPEAIVCSFPADHMIPDGAALRRAVEVAIGGAREGRFCLVGITPTFATPGLGYIQLAPGDGLRQVQRFTEKPGRELAQEFVDRGFLWNGGMWISRVGVLLDLLSRYHPELAAGLRAIAAEPTIDPQRWQALTAITIDDALAIPATRDGLAYATSVDMPWYDVGDFEALDEVIRGGREELAVLGGGDVIGLDATGLVAARSGRLVAVVGLDDAVVVDTDDVVLVASRDAVQQVKQLRGQVADRWPDLA